MTDIDKVREALYQKVDESPVGDVISIPQLRRAVKMSKERFDRAVIALSDADEVALHMHDIPRALPERERAELVVHPDGTHFIGIVLRRIAGTAPTRGGGRRTRST